MNLKRLITDQLLERLKKPTPRKTFSIEVAHEMNKYIEARTIEHMKSILTKKTPEEIQLVQHRLIELADMKTDIDLLIKSRVDKKNTQ